MVIADVPSSVENTGTGRFISVHVSHRFWLSAGHHMSHHQQSCGFGLFRQRREKKQKKKQS